MPIYLFKCPNDHELEFFKQTPYRKVVRKRCSKCGLYAHRDYVAEHKTVGKVLNLDYENDPISHLAKKRSFKGITIENLTPNPVRVTNKEQYDRLLKSTHSLERLR